MLVFSSHRPAAVLGPAAARRGIIGIFREVVVHREFLATLDGPQTHVNDVALHYAGDDVGAAAMVDDLRAAASDGAVQGPVPVELEQIGVLAPIAFVGLAIADALP